MVDHNNQDSIALDIRQLAVSIWNKKIRIALVSAFLLVITYLVLSLVPKTYESSASILVEPRENIFSVGASGAGARGVSDSVIMSSQVELIKSSQTLLEVVRSLNLIEVPEFNGTASSTFDPILTMIGQAPVRRVSSEQKILSRLSRAITVVQERNSRVLSILVRARDRELAANIANAVAAAHISRRVQLSIEDTTDASRWLQSEIEKLRISVVEAQSEVASFRINNDLFVGINNTSLLDQQLSNIAAQITTAQERRNLVQSRADLIGALLDAGQPIDGVAEVQGSVIIQRLSQDKAQLQGQRAQLSATLLSNHPQVRSISAQITEIDRQITREGRRVADAMIAEAAIEETLAANLQQDFARLKGSASSAATSTVELQELEREAKAQSDLLQTYLLRFREATARADSGAVLPDVRVVTLAMPALRAVAPKSTMILIAVAIVSGAVQVAGILFVELSRNIPGGALYAPGTSLRREGEQFSALGLTSLNENNSAGSPPLADADIMPGKKSSLGSKIKGRLKTILQKDRTDPAVEEFEQDGVVSGNDRDQEIFSQNSIRKAHPGLSDAPPSRSQIEKKPETPDGASHDYASHDYVSHDYVSPDQVSADSYEQQFYDLADDLADGRQQLVFVGSFDRNGDAASVVEVLGDDVLEAGRSVAIIDAGSSVISDYPGISDLAAGDVDFGEVVFHGDTDEPTIVNWGRLNAILSGSDRPKILVEALCDICEVVIVMVGGERSKSNLSIFAGLNAHLVLVAAKDPDNQRIAETLAQTKALGFENTSILTLAKKRANRDRVNVA
ncbi:MAG: GumC family protein [Devosiaceae bacterium]|nr:GumC family protein [Devosiaceae bacterium]